MPARVEIVLEGELLPTGWTADEGTRCAISRIALFCGRGAKFVRSMPCSATISGVTRCRNGDFT